MPRFGLYVDQIVSFDHRRHIPIVELAAVIVHNPGLGVFDSLERSPQLYRHRLSVKADLTLAVSRCQNADDFDSLEPHHRHRLGTLEAMK